MNKLCVLALLTTSLAAAAQESPANLNRVDVAGTSTRPPVRYDVSRACPALQRTLAEDLGWFTTHGDVPREMRVSFEVDSQGGTFVKAPGPTQAAADFRHALRRTLNRVDCEHAAQGRQAYAFQLAFVTDDEGQPNSNRLALVELAP